MKKINLLRYVCALLLVNILSCSTQNEVLNKNQFKLHRDYNSNIYGTYLEKGFNSNFRVTLNEDSSFAYTDSLFLCIGDEENNNISCTILGNYYLSSDTVFFTIDSISCPKINNRAINDADLITNTHYINPSIIRKLNNDYVLIPLIDWNNDNYFKIDNSQKIKLNNDNFGDRKKLNSSSFIFVKQ